MKCVLVLRTDDCVYIHFVWFWIQQNSIMSYQSHIIFPRVSSIPTKAFQELRQQTLTTDFLTRRFDFIPTCLIHIWFYLIVFPYFNRIFKSIFILINCIQFYVIVYSLVWLYLISFICYLILFNLHEPRATVVSLFT